LSGAFGSGAAFAFEDAYILAQAISESQRTGRHLASALKVYDKIRSPHYEALYDILDGNADSAKEVAAAHPEFDDDEFVEEIVSKGLGKNTQWIYKYDVSRVL
jgi:salicylate hydroxylase